MIKNHKNKNIINIYIKKDVNHPKTISLENTN